MGHSMNRQILCVLLGFALVFVGAGCSCGSNPDPLSDGGSDGGQDAGEDASTHVVTGVSISPTHPTLDIQGSTPAQQEFALTATYDDGTTADVTLQSTFSVADPTLGGFVLQKFTSHTDRGGTTQVTGTFQGKSATTPITIVKHQSFTTNDPSLPADPQAPFGGPVDAARAPSLVYPNDGVLLPPNLGRLEVHFRPHSGADTLFRVSFENAITDVTVYLRCDTPMNGGCIYAPEDAVWKAIATGNRGGDPVKISVAATDDTGTSVGTSSEVRISFSEQDLQGGLYYWTTSTSSIMRFDFAGTQTTASTYLNAASTNPPDGGSSGVNCLGCHALSRDGTKVVAEVQGQNDGRILMWDVANAAPIVDFPAADKSIFESWDPDGGTFVGVDMDNGHYALRIHDGNTGQVVTTIPGTGDSTHPADHPDWSNDGQKIVYVKMGVKNTCQRMHEGAIELISRLPDGGWSAPSELVARETNVNHYYPAFAPSDQFIVFDRSECIHAGGSDDGSCNADTDPSASVYALALDGGTPINMVSANSPGPEDKLADGGVQTLLTNTFPKWSPFVTQQSHDSASRVMWLTFASTRQYGLRSPTGGSGEAELGKGTLLWMVAIDPDKVAQGVDPSYPAFALPFQDITTSNHIAQWTQKVVQGVCTQNGASCDAPAAACCSGLACLPNGGDPPVNVCQVVIN